MVRQFESKQEECLVILMEECGELIQECCKMIRKNEYASPAFVDEVGDVVCMIDLMIEHELLTWQEINKRVGIKRNKLKKWSNLID